VDQDGACAAAGPGVSAGLSLRARPALRTPGHTRTAVFLAVQRRLVVAVARKSTSGPPYDRLRDACAAYLDECTLNVARIVLVDGPAVLGKIDWHETEDRMWLRALRDLIDAAQRDGRFASVDTDLAARVISASLTQLATAAIDDPSSPPARDVQLVLAAML
jgi:hypothetical protein